MKRQLYVLLVITLMLAAADFHRPAESVTAQGMDAAVQITYPSSGSMVPNGAVNILGTANLPRMRGYTLEYRPLTAAVSPDGWQMIVAPQNAIVGSILAIWDTTFVAPGTYELRLTVTTVDCEDPTIALVSPLGIGVEPETTPADGTVLISEDQGRTSSARAHMGIFATTPAHSAALHNTLQSQFSNIITAVEPGALVPVIFPAHPMPDMIWAHGYDVSSPNPPFDLVMQSGQPLGPDVRVNTLVISSSLADEIGVQTGHWLDLQVDGITAQFEIVGIAAAPCRRVWMAWQSVAWLMNWTIDGTQVPQGYYVQMGATPPDTAFLHSVSDMLTSALAPHNIMIDTVSLVPDSGAVASNTGLVLVPIQQS